MIASVQLISNSKNKVALVTEQLDFKCHIVLYKVEALNTFSRFDIEITFQERIQLFRNHDYTWVPIDRNRIANWYAPKIISLENGAIVQANRSVGIWEVDKNKPHVLLWRFNPENAQPYTKYSEGEHDKTICQSFTDYDFSNPLALLFPKNKGLEVSRSIHPFSAILCFTDHCDFDTVTNLKAQRLFFKTHGIQMTKGFFLNQFSKRTDNASFETDAEELLAWKADGHELAYHSLSQSIKSGDLALSDFKNFEPPVDDLVTWIDHGYQPYNLSLFEASGMEQETYADVLKEKGIRILWNYIDSGTNTQGVLNQISPEQFTLKAYIKGIKGFGVFKFLSLLIKNILFYFVNSPKQTALYKEMAANFKKKRFVKLLGNLMVLLQIFIPILVFYKKKKQAVYPLAKFTPLFFKHQIKNTEFMIFQTLEMVDLKYGLNKRSVDSFIKESGVCIAHTYFSVPLAYHHGKLLAEEGIDSQVTENFSYLGEKISKKAIWNPTLNQLVSYMGHIEDLVFNINQEGQIYITTSNNLITRPVSL
ncbi:hypothetical protein [Formosa maritima]|uniref:NodB homology domain-containing protein n=1 Tax=Formosa maritima TaxID=2592046 RepID=A0A5D0GFR7_9FLAO|nr:hypothetical protein [Formosa maritima]TYA56647.1 hypothetical protein FVF61_05785 [Formosa maritima]